MENEKKITASNETIQESKNYSKEYNYINQLVWIIDFNLFKKSTQCENCFYSTIARYIDTMQKERPNDREIAVENFIYEIKKCEWNDEYEKIMQIDIYLSKLKIDRYKKHNDQAWAELLEFELKNFKYTYKKDQDWKIRRILPWVIIDKIPSRYYYWLWESWLWDRIVKENRSAFARTIREQREKSEELKKDL